MRILISGVRAKSWSVDRSWSVEESPLIDADTLHEYDLIVLKPTLFGGILPDYADAPRHNAGVNPEAGEQFTDTIRKRSIELLLASVQGRVVIFPTIETTLNYRVPKALDPRVRSFNQAVGQNSQNYDFKTVSNMDLLSFWGTTFHSGAGESVKSLCPGHPMNHYFCLKKMRWDTAFGIKETLNQTLLATDRDGLRVIGAEVESGGGRVLLIPESQDKEALKTLVQGVEKLREWHDRTKVRSSTEQKILIELAQMRVAMSELMDAAHKKEQELYQVEEHGRGAISIDPVLEAAYRDYKQGCSNRDIGLLYRAYERLKKQHGGENSLRHYLKWDELELQEWNQLRNAITKVANRSERHPDRNDPAAPPDVSNQEFDRAIEAMKTILEKYVDVAITQKH